MMDLISVREGLESPIVAAFTHVAGVVGGAMEADVTALRLHHAPSHPHTRLALAPRLRLHAPGRAALRKWIDSDHPVDDFLTHRYPGGHVCRPRDLNSHPTLDGAGATRFDGLRPEIDVIDGIMATYPVSDKFHAVMLLARCRPGDRFEDPLIEQLRQLHTPIARALNAACRQQLGLGGNPPSHALPPNLTVAQLVARLSETEQQVLRYVRSNATEPEIAKALNRSRHTIHVHVKNIYRKLGVGSRRQLHALLASG